MRRIYLDHQTATPVREEVLAAMMPFFREHFGNPASLHAQGLRTRDAIETARAQVAGLVGAASPAEIVFTSGGTEAVNLAILGHCRAVARHGGHIVHSRIEHRAVLAPLEALTAEGFQATAIAPDREGRIHVEAVREALRPDTVLIAVHHANHEIGTIEPVMQIAGLARDRGIAYLCDATASAGWLPMDVQAWGVPLLALAPHRFGGPKGVGVLYRSRRVRLNPVLHGGDQEGGIRPGTENVPAIVGAGVAAEWARREQPRLSARAGALQSRLLDLLRQNVPHLRLHGPEPGPERLPNTLNLGVEFTEGEGLALLLDARGLSVASGPACGAKTHPASHVLEAIGIGRDLARGGVTLSIGRGTTASEIRRAATLFSDAVRHLRNLSPAWDDFLREERSAPPASTRRRPRSDRRRSARDGRRLRS